MCLCVYIIFDAGARQKGGGGEGGSHVLFVMTTIVLHSGRITFVSVNESDPSSVIPSYILKYVKK